MRKLYCTMQITMSPRRPEWRNLVGNNIWIKYFMKNPMYKKENWIDFESEIRKVIEIIPSGTTKTLFLVKM